MSQLSRRIYFRCTEEEYNRIRKVASILNPIAGEANTDNISFAIRLLLNLGYMILESKISSEDVKDLVGEILIKTVYKTRFPQEYEES